MSDSDIRKYIEAAYRIIMGKLTKAQRKTLGLPAPPLTEPCDQP
jgi:predicted DNA-binding protein (MmcQ/YjbR family)